MNLDSITHQQYADLAASNPLLIIAVGSLEQHGRHMPLGTDVFIPMGIANKIADRYNSIVAPPIGYGVVSGNLSGSGPAFGGTTSVSPAALEITVRDVVSDFLRQGICKFLVLNGHSENGPVVLSALHHTLANRPDSKALLVDWWNMVPLDFMKKNMPGEAQAIAAGHASYLETLVMLALRPDLTDLARLKHSKPRKEVTYEIVPTDFDAIAPDGVNWPDSKSLIDSLTSALAKATLDVIVDSILAAIQTNFG